MTNKQQIGSGPGKQTFLETSGPKSGFLNDPSDPSICLGMRRPNKPIFRFLPTFPHSKWDGSPGPRAYSALLRVQWQLAIAIMFTELTTLSPGLHLTLDHFGSVMGFHCQEMCVEETRALGAVHPQGRAMILNMGKTYCPSTPSTWSVFCFFQKAVTPGT